MLSLPLRANRLSASRASNPLGAVAPYHEVTDIFTTALPMLTHRQSKGTLGNRRNRLSVTSTQVLALRQNLSRGAHSPREAASTVRASKAGFEPAFPWSEVCDIFTTSVG
jgi:hypothetical protein